MVVVLLFCFLVVVLSLKNNVLPRRDFGCDWVPERAPQGRNEEEHSERSGELSERAVVDNEIEEGETIGQFNLGWKVAEAESESRSGYAKRASATILK
jgi:hypothetical protein